MNNKIDSGDYMKCPKCGSIYIRASAEVKVDLRLRIYDNGVSAEIDNIDCDEYDLYELKCECCGYEFAGSFFGLQNIIKEKGDNNE